MEPMTTERFLGLLNKANRTPEEEQELQNELKRQASTQQAEVPAEQAVVTPEASEPVQPTETAPVVETPAVEATPVVENEPYSLTQLKQETEDAIKFLDTQENTIAVEMAKAAFTQAAYWISTTEK